ncbi:hypothetical protein ABWH96_21095 [Marivirga tractuosa]|uniref:hypothetical protein n=1 Tax=Marivirga tractuosa TaxID=1006 RepID=UPI0035CEC1FA
MKLILNIFLIGIIASCDHSKKDESDSPLKLTISSHIDTDKPINQEIIGTLRKFLETKNKSLYENKYWYKPDFGTYIFPYSDIYNIEHKDSIQNFYQPTLMEIVDTDEEHKKLAKIAFIGHDEINNENTIKAIYNIVATKTKGNIVFSNPLGYFTKDWDKIQKGSIQYVVSPQKEFDETEAQMQLEAIDKISEFYSIDPLPITYYSCVGLKELFVIKGFDYKPTMYIDGGGGLAERHNIVLSANNTEVYTHEIVHHYNLVLSSSTHKLIEEGVATYIGGTRTYSYSWHKENLKNHLNSNPDIDLSKYLKPFERVFVGDTSIPYMVGALICERTFRIYGKEHLFVLITGGVGFWELLSEVGLTKENLDAELKKELQLLPTLCM